MSTINVHYTFQYAQPESYRFSHDSVFLAREVFERERLRANEALEILDLCSGCGIVGLDLLFHLRKESGLEPCRCDFMDVQEDYRRHFEENVRRFGKTRTSIDLFEANFREAHARRYDLIVCNPPYFRKGSGKLSPDEFKNRCRFFLDASPDELWSSIRNLLKPSGTAYVLARDFSEETRVPGLRLTLAGEIRGTDLVKAELAPWL